MNYAAEDGPAIRLGNKEWIVPMLAAKQNRIIDPLILSLLPLFAQLRANSAAISKIMEKEYDALLEIAFQAIRRAVPDLTRDQYMDMPISLPELIAAFPVIAQQTGVFEKLKPGEARAAA